MTDAPPGPRIRVLFVLSQLVQHGSERYLFELCKALDRRQFDIEVMTRPFFVKRHYYYSRLRALGIPVHRRLISRRFFIRPIRRLHTRSRLIRYIIRNMHRLAMRIQYRGFFESYDVIAVIGIETYCDALSPTLDANTNVVIHHVSYRFQFERDYYAECRQSRMVVPDSQVEEEIAGSAMPDAELFRLPLPIDLSNRPLITIPQDRPGRPIRIGVASRLFPDRPNEPLFRCFAALMSEADAELYFYGGGDPDLYSSLLDTLGIRERTRFVGHESELREAIERDELSLLWLVSMGESISYASIEIASMGMPMVFWNLSTVPYEDVVKRTDGALHTFSDIAAFVDFNLAMLADRTERERLGRRLRAFTVDRYDVSSNIGMLQAYYRQVATAVEHD